MNCSGGADVYIACYDPNGNLNWVKSGNGIGTTDFGRKVGCDGLGNVYIVGQFQNYFFDTISLTSNGLNDLFISKVDSSGEFIWAKSYGGKGEDGGVDIDVLENGNLFYCGYFSDTCSFDGSTFISFGSYDILIASAFEDGSLNWVEQAGGQGVDGALSIQAKNETESFVGGNFVNIASFDSIDIQSNGGIDFFIGKILAPSTSIFVFDRTENVNVYPNPVSSGQQIFIELKNDLGKRFQIQMIDGLGKLISKENIYETNGFANFIIPHFSSGIYYIRIILSNGTVSSLRISIQN